MFFGLQHLDIKPICCVFCANVGTLRCNNVRCVIKLESGFISKSNVALKVNVSNLPKFDV